MFDWFFNLFRRRISRRISDQSVEGGLLMMQGRFEEAITSYDRAIKINPRDVSAWSGKALVLMELDRFGEVIACDDRVLEIDPRYAEVWSQKGVALGGLGRWQEALRCFEEAHRLEFEPAAEGIEICKKELGQSS
ncbi:tetratricopeptide repeat protein [bacterium]|nr:tetratricopeptide repeat protein [bacterium]